MSIIYMNVKKEIGIGWDSRDIGYSGGYGTRTSIPYSPIIYFVFFVLIISVPVSQEPCEFDMK